MNGVRELAQRILDRPVRLALPPPLRACRPLPRARFRRRLWAS